MKSGRGGFREGRKEQLMFDPRHDSYKAKAKFPDPTRCPACDACYQDGRWIWGPCAQDAHERLCPACQRIKDGFPAGYVTLRGDLPEERRKEILSMVRHLETKEKAEHPLQRIMAIEQSGGETLITTTDSHLARGIAEHIHKACKGRVTVHPVKEDNLYRATWEPGEG